MSSVGDQIRIDRLLDALQGKDISNWTIILGTCKDCKHFHNVRKDFNICDLWTIACADNHFCADFEKRGDENGI